MAKSLSSKDDSSLNRIWELCGFKSRIDFENNFKRIHGVSFKEYLNNL
ncbi:MAG: hypothetical protein VW371_00045 [Bacteroidota bacterium]